MVRLESDARMGSDVDVDYKLALRIMGMVNRKDSFQCCMAVARGWVWWCSKSSRKHESHINSIKMWRY